MFVERGREAKGRARPSQRLERQVEPVLTVYVEAQGTGVPDLQVVGLIWPDQATVPRGWGLVHAQAHVPSSGGVQRPSGQ